MHHHHQHGNPIEAGIGSFSDMWSPGVILFTILLLILYFALTGPMRHRFADSSPVPGKQKALFVLAMLVFYAGAGSPINYTGHHYLFSMHMLQMSLLFFVLPPLLMVGIPGWLWTVIFRKERVRAVLRVLTKPLVAAVVFNSLLSFYHVPFILDFATSRVAQGKMRVAHNEGRSVAPGTLIDEHGLPTNNPGVVVVPQSNGRMGALLPFGDYKGFGMAVACELLGGALTGGGTWHQESDGRRAVLNSMLTIVIDPKALGASNSFASEALAFVDWLRQSPDAPGSSGVQLAGEPERAARAARSHEGILVDDNTWSELTACAAKLEGCF